MVAVTRGPAYGSAQGEGLGEGNSRRGPYPLSEEGGKGRRRWETEDQGPDRAYSRAFLAGRSADSSKKTDSVTVSWRRGRQVRGRLGGPQYVKQGAGARKGSGAGHRGLNNQGGMRFPMTLVRLRGRRKTFRRLSGTYNGSTPGERGELNFSLAAISAQPDAQGGTEEAFCFAKCGR